MSRTLSIVAGLFLASSALAQSNKGSVCLGANLAKVEGSDEVKAIRSGNPLASALNADVGVAWAKAEVVADSPDKAGVENGGAIGALLRRRLLEAASEVKSELLIVSPYFVPGEKGMQLLRSLLLVLVLQGLREVMDRVEEQDWDIGPHHLQQVGEDDALRLKARRDARRLRSRQRVGDQCGCCPFTLGIGLGVDIGH